MEGNDLLKGISYHLTIITSKRKRLVGKCDRLLCRQYDTGFGIEQRHSPAPGCSRGSMRKTLKGHTT